MFTQQTLNFGNGVRISAGDGVQSIIIDTIKSEFLVDGKPVTGMEASRVLNQMKTGRMTLA